MKPAGRSCRTDQGIGSRGRYAACFTKVADFRLAERETGERRARVDRLGISHNQLKLFQPIKGDLRKLAFGAGLTR
jgi:hypothetical protein